MRFDDVIIINKVLELYCKFEKNSYQTWENNESYLVFKTDRNGYWIGINTNFEDEPESLHSQISIKIKDGSFIGQFICFEKIEIENKQFDTIEQLENLLYDIANKEYEEVLNEI